MIFGVVGRTWYFLQYSLYMFFYHLSHIGWYISWILYLAVLAGIVFCAFLLLSSLITQAQMMMPMGRPYGGMPQNYMSAQYAEVPHYAQVTTTTQRFDQNNANIPLPVISRYSM